MAGPRLFGSGLTLVAVMFLLVRLAAGIDNGIGLTPPRGWRSW
jgi:hypothetical protein